MAIRAQRKVPSFAALFLLAGLALLAGSGCEPSTEDGTQPAPIPPVEQGGDAPIRYSVSFVGAAQHLVQVEAQFDADLVDETGRLELMMAVWTPGSYLVREYSRHLEGLVAFAPDGRPLTVVKSAKNRWIIDGVSPTSGLAAAAQAAAAPAAEASAAEAVSGEAGADPEVEAQAVPVGGAKTGSVRVRYRLYCRELTVRTNFVDADLAVLNGAPTFLTPVGADSRPREVRLQLPEAWPHSATSLPAHPSGEPHHFVAESFDILVDSPIVAGQLETRTFEVDGISHEVVNAGDTAFLDLDQQLRDVERLTRAQIDFWGVIPYEHYVFLNVIGEAGGGLEHLSSTLMLTSRWRMGDPEGYEGWLGLVSHELFHAWNVKRLRPAPLGPFDYETEAYTRSLWIAEGITSYYDSLLLLRAGLIDKDSYLESLSGQIGRLQTTPGRKVRSVAESSLDAWVKAYRPDENTSNTAISYYTKGAVVAFVLDAALRRHSNNARSLDDAMRLAYERYSGDRGFTPGDFRRVVLEVAGKKGSEEVEDIFERYVNGTDELNYGPALDWLGLRFVSPVDDEDAEPEGWLGARTEDRGGRWIVRSVPRATPAYEAGLNVDDEILAIEGYRIPAAGLERRMTYYPPGSEVELLISRRNRIRGLSLTLGEKPPESWDVEVDPSSESARARFEAWTGVKE